jgi:hypothetical protein
MAKPSMEDVLGLIGWDLEDGTTTKDRFREFLLKDSWEPEQYMAWLEECLKKADSARRTWYNALQDIAVAVGKRLGFEVEFGRYSGSTTEIAYDGLWRCGPKAVVLVEVKASGWPVTTVSQLGEYVRRYQNQHRAEDVDVYGLYILGSNDVQHLVDMIKGGDYRNQLRLIAFDGLIKLWRLKADLEAVSGPGDAAERIQSIILPMENVNLGSLVTMLLEIAELISAEKVESDQPTTPDVRPEDDESEPWIKDELFALFEHNTAWQNAFLTVLALMEEKEIFHDAALRLVNSVAQRHMPSSSGRSCKSVAGLRGGFKIRKGNKPDFVGARWAFDGEKWQASFWLIDRYRDWVREWVTKKSWALGSPSDSPS